jgi:hypothetical protein
LSDYDIYDQASVALANPALCEFATPPPPSCTTNNPFVFGVPQRGIEFGGYPNDGNFTWSVAIVNGNNDGPAARNFKDVYARVSQTFNLERDPSVRKEVRAAGPTGPRDHTSLRLGAFGYYGRNALNIGGSLFPNLPTIHEPFYRVGGDFRFKYRKFELWGLGMFGHDTNVVPNGPSDIATGFVSTRPVTFAGGFAEAEYWIYPWLIGLMRYDVVNSPISRLDYPVMTRETVSAPAFRCWCAQTSRSRLSINAVSSNRYLTRTDSFGQTALWWELISCSDVVDRPRAQCPWTS